MVRDWRTCAPEKGGSLTHVSRVAVTEAMAHGVPPMSTTASGGKSEPVPKEPLSSTVQFVPASRGEVTAAPVSTGVMSRS